jgi:excisionase family DNA binding protein
MMPEPVAVLTVEEAAALLRISRGTAYEAARRGELPTVRLGRRLLVPRARLAALLGTDVEGRAPNGETPVAGPAPRGTSTAAQGRHDNCD